MQLTLVLVRLDLAISHRLPHRSQDLGPAVPSRKVGKVALDLFARVLQLLEWCTGRLKALWE